MSEAIPYPMTEVIKAQNEHNWEKYYILKTNDVFVEAGAFWGKYAIVSSMKGCKSILIEPEPSNYATLEQVVKVYDLKNTTLIKKAVGNITGKSYFYANNTGSSRLLESNENNKDVIEVNVDTLDNILGELKVEQVDLLSCDVEGSEIDLLKGTHNYFRQRKIKNVAIACYHNSRFNKIAIEILRTYGFKNLVYEEGVVYGNI